MFTVVGLVAVIPTYLYSEMLVIAYGGDGGYVSIILQSDYNDVTLYMSNCHDPTSSSLNTTT